MPTSSNQCFLCEKPTVICYDFLVVEQAFRCSGTVKRQTEHRTERLSGIARITLCQECLEQRLQLHINRITKGNGLPRMFKKKDYVISNNLLSKVQKGIFEKCGSMRQLFHMTLFDPKGLYVSDVNNNTLDATDFKERTSQKIQNGVDIIFVPFQVDNYSGFEQEYVLLKFDENSPPFSKSILPVLPNSQTVLVFMDDNTIEWLRSVEGLLLKENLQKLPQIKMIYQQLEAV